MSDYDFEMVNGCLSKYRGSDKEVVIPEGVKTIGNWAFCRRKHITSVVIPNSVSYIDDNAFLQCENLKNINIPSGVTSIGKKAFCDCKNLTSITVPNSVTYIGKEAFRGCINLKDISILNNAANLGANVFERCDKLADKEGFIIIDGVLYDYIGKKPDITIPDNVCHIGNNAFENSQILTSIVIPDSVISIRNSAFRGCENITKITVSDEVTSIGRSAFHECTNLTELVADINIVSDSHSKKIIAYSYLRSPKSFSGKKYIDSIEKYIFSQRKMILEKVFDDDIVNGLELFLKAGKITKQNIDSEYLNPAVAANAAQCIAFLQDWKNKNITTKNKERELANALIL